MTYKAWTASDFKDLQRQIAQDIVKNIDKEQLLKGVFMELLGICKTQIDAHINVATPELLSNFGVVHSEITLLIRELERDIAEMKKLSGKRAFDAAFNEVKQRLENHIVTLNPDLLTNFQKLHQDILDLLLEMNKKFKSMQEKYSKLFESSSLAEDVFKMRDEMKDIRNKMGSFNKGIKALSKLQVFEDKE